MAKLEAIIRLLERGESIPEKHKLHRLKGEWTGCMELHIEPDWVLIYEVRGNELYLEATGSHSDLFG